jgi:hypothetical protein
VVVVGLLFWVGRVFGAEVVWAVGELEVHILLLGAVVHTRLEMKQSLLYD